MSAVYLDHHAATPLVPAARAAIDEALALPAASPSSTHGAGRAARALLERARDRLASSLGAAPADLVATSGGTEALALALAGLAPTARRIVTTSLEHPAVARALGRRASAGAEVRALPPGEVAGAIDGSIGLVAVQHANHETGEILDVGAIADRCRAHGVPLVVDACQSFGKIPLDLASLGASAVAVAASKIGGPSGAGALFVARGVELEPLLLGGAQERGRRAGTPGLVAWAGLGGAASVIGERLAATDGVARRRDRLEAGLLALGAVSNAPSGPRLPTVVNVSFPERRGPTLVAALDLEGVEVSSGAACSSGLDAPSPVLLASFPGEPWRAAAALRFSLGPETTDPEIDRALDAVQRVIARRA